MKFLFDEHFCTLNTRFLENCPLVSLPIEAIKTLFSAVSLLQNNDPETAKKAHEFISHIFMDQKDGLFFLEKFSQPITSWHSLDICSVYHNTCGNFLEYKVSFRPLEGREQTLHFHVQYEIKNGRFRILSQSAPMVRIIGDAILQSPGLPFPLHPSLDQAQELERQVHLAKDILIQTGGAGIAANQCAGIESPYCFTIVGVFYDEPKHLAAVDERYPNVSFPEAVIMVNPVIVSTSEERQSFNHACLSVPCGNRAALESPLEIKVEFQDFTGHMALKQRAYRGIDALVLWHELFHIVEGKTYMDAVFENLKDSDLFLFQQLIQEELHKREINPHKALPNLSVPPFYWSFKLDDNGHSRLHTADLLQALPNMTEETLGGLLQRSRIAMHAKNQA